MIEITAGKLYVCDYFMVVKSESNYVKIAKPTKIQAGELPPSPNSATYWELKKVKTLQGDVRWELQATAREFGDFVDYYVEHVFGRFGLGV